jgi:hypothetical protein
MSSAWIGVIGALGGVAITALVGLVTAILNHRWSLRASYEDRETDLRLKRAELRRTAYARFLSAHDHLRDALEADAETQSSDAQPNWSFDSWFAKEPELLRELQIADNEALLVAGSAVVSSLQAYSAAAMHYWHALVENYETADDTATQDAYKELLTAMREEQAIDLSQ